MRIARARVMNSPPSQEVDDINKKLIILPGATLEGLAKAILCSQPLFLSHIRPLLELLGLQKRCKKCSGEGLMKIHFALLQA